MHTLLDPMLILYKQIAIKLRKISKNFREFVI